MPVKNLHCDRLEQLGVPESQGVRKGCSKVYTHFRNEILTLKYNNYRYLFFFRS